jgi:putative flippase GtrA
MMSNRFVRFLLTGGCAALVNLGSRFALNTFMSFQTAVAVAYLFGVVTAYVLAKIFVFDKSGLTAATEFQRFVIVNVMSLAIVWVVSVGLAIRVFPAVGFRWQPEAIAHLIGVLSPSVISYFAHKHYTFRAAAAPSDELAITTEITAAPEQGR